MPVGRSERRRAKLAAKLKALFDPDGPEPDETPEIDFFFADDSRQTRPSRPGMGPLAAIGGLNVPSEEVAAIDRGISEVCAVYGFPVSEPFKWSPSRELWMHSNLVGDKRTEFYLAIVDLLKAKEAVATVVVEDTNCQCATETTDTELDVASLFIERANNQCVQDGSQGFIVVDRPPGGRSDEDRFLRDCALVLESGTDFVKPERIAHNVFSSSSQLSRLLQAADLVTGCVLAMVSGESRYSPPVFRSIKFLMNKQSDRIGGIGLKIHPDLKYGNLYHWLVGDSHFWKGSTGYPMPMAGRSYSDDPFQP